MANETLPPDIKAEMEAFVKAVNWRPFDLQPGEKWEDLCFPVFDENEVWEYNRNLRLKIADKALLYYKDTQGAEFELVEIKSCDLVVHPLYNTYHISFEAKSKCDVDSHPQLFFAEAYELAEKMDDYIIKICVICDPSSSDVRKGCYLCGEDVLHPRDVEFFRGPPEEFHQSNDELEIKHLAIH